MHVSSIAVGTQNNWIVTLRNLNTVLSLARNGTRALQWTLSSSLESDFAFSHDVAKFYQPHSAQQLPNGDLLLLDDGNDRPGCLGGTESGALDDDLPAVSANASARTAGCFSRAVMYSLERGPPPVARLVWQFAYPVHFALDGKYAENATTSFNATAAADGGDGRASAGASCAALGRDACARAAARGCAWRGGSCVDEDVDDDGISTSGGRGATTDDDDADDDDGDATCARLAKGACQQTSECEWRRDDGTCFASERGDDAARRRGRRRLANPKRPAATTNASSSSVDNEPPATTVPPPRGGEASPPPAQGGAAAASSAAPWLDRNENLRDVFLHDAYNFDGGTVERLSNGHVLVGLTELVSSRAWNPRAAMLLFEVDDDGEAVARMEIPKPKQTGSAAFGGYRTLPWESIGGETSSSPFGPMAHVLS